MADDSVGNALTVVRGAFVFGAGRILSNFFGFFVTLLLTTALGTAGYGAYTFGRQVISVASAFSQLGAGNALLRYIPKHDGDIRRQNQTLGLVFSSSFVFSVLCGVAIFWFAPQINSLTLEDPLFTPVLQVFAVFLPFKTLTTTVVSTFRSIELLEYRVAINNVLTPVFRIVAVGLAFLVGVSTVGIIASVVGAGIIVAIIGFRLLLTRTSLRPTSGIELDDALEYFYYSLPLTASRAGSIMYTRIDVFMIGFFLSSSAVGIYGLARVISGLLMLPLAAVNQLFPPVASDLYERDELDQLRTLYRQTTRWTVTLSLFMSASIVIYRHEILRIFGEDFAAGSAVIAVFAIGKVTNAAVGPSGFVLIMTDHQYANLVNSWVTGALNVALNFVLILKYGIIGAAIATGITTVMLNLARLVQVWYFEGLHPYSLQFVKPLVAIVFASVTMYAARSFLEGIRLVAFGGIVGGAVFLVALLALGLEAEDRHLLRKSWTRLSTELTGDEATPE